MDFEANVRVALIYFDIFDYPLPKNELYKFFPIFDHIQKGVPFNNKNSFAQITSLLSIILTFQRKIFLWQPSQQILRHCTTGKSARFNLREFVDF
jgi:predicted metalloenzyme YecM